MNKERHIYCCLALAIALLIVVLVILGLCLKKPRQEFVVDAFLCDGDALLDEWFNALIQLGCVTNHTGTIIFSGLLSERQSEDIPYNITNDHARLVSIPQFTVVENRRAIVNAKGKIGGAWFLGQSSATSPSSSNVTKYDASLGIYIRQLDGQCRVNLRISAEYETYIHSRSASGLSQVKETPGTLSFIDTIPPNRWVVWKVFSDYSAGVHLHMVGVRIMPVLQNDLDGKRMELGANTHYDTCD